MSRQTSADRARHMYQLELAERAALLQRLGYSREDALTRLRTNVAWDFELHDKPEHARTVEQIVDRVFARHGVGGGGAPQL
ncbi:MAG: hypothetical protein KC503_21135 [Myxococcales bacterium]|nr:hypothetical protein [Myxococcales bacterium]